MVCIRALLAKKSPATLMSALDKPCIDHLRPIPCVVCEGRHCWAPQWPKGLAGASSSCRMIFPIARSMSFSPSLSLGCTREAMGSSCRGLLSPFWARASFLPPHQQVEEALFFSSRSCRKLIILGIDDKLQPDMKSRRAAHICAGVLRFVVHAVSLCCAEVQVEGCCQIILVSELKSSEKNKL